MGIEILCKVYKITLLSYNFNLKILIKGTKNYERKGLITNGAKERLCIILYVEI